jgi:hypothetical protein
MRLVTVSAPGADPRPLLAAYRRHLECTGRGNASYWWAARDFFSRWPDPAMWAVEPLQVRLSASSAHRPLITFLMLHGHLRPGYDYLLERKISSLWRELEGSSLAEDLARVLDAAAELGFGQRVRTANASQVPARLLIQTGRRLDSLTAADLEEFAAPQTAGGITSPGSASLTGSCSTSASWPGRRSPGRNRCHSQTGSPALPRRSPRP